MPQELHLRTDILLIYFDLEKKKEKKPFHKRKSKGFPYFYKYGKKEKKILEKNITILAPFMLFSGINYMEIRLKIISRWLNVFWPKRLIVPESSDAFSQPNVVQLSLRWTRIVKIKRSIVQKKFDHYLKCSSILTRYKKIDIEFSDKDLCFTVILEKNKPKTSIVCSHSVDYI